MYSLRVIRDIPITRIPIMRYSRVSRFVRMIRKAGKGTKKKVSLPEINIKQGD
jgi:hypothetical protein